MIAGMRVSARRWRAVTVLVALAAAAVPGCSGSPSPPHLIARNVTAQGLVTARPVDPVASVGALFIGDTATHTCTGAVLHSGSGNLIVTAAHCLPAAGAVSFAPGFRDAVNPDDTWTVDAVFLDPRWVADQNPLADYAIARVRRDGGGRIESPTVPGLSLGRAPATGTMVSVTAYGAGEGGPPIGCRVPTATDPLGYPSVTCVGLVDGTSGAPMIAGTTVIGVIGGLRGGGCDQREVISYSSPFDDRIAGLLARAEAGGPGDTAPSTYDDGCSS